MIVEKITYQGPIIDCHMHVWDLQKNVHPWLNGGSDVPFRYGNYDAIKNSFLPPDYRRLAKRHNVVATVYMEAEWDPCDPVGETDYITELARAEGLPNAVIAQAWLDHADVAELLKSQARYSLVRSIRHKPGGPGDIKEVCKENRTLMSNDLWRQGYDLLEKFGLHFDLQTPWWNLWEAKRLAEDFPQTIILLNHSGLPADRSREGLAAWRNAMAALVDCPNVIIKISGLGQSAKPWTVESNSWIITEIIAMFGAQRAMFGSNFPVDSLCGSFDDIYDGFKQIASRYSDAENRLLFYDNAEKYYRPIHSTSISAVSERRGRY